MGLNSNNAFTVQGLFEINGNTGIVKDVSGAIIYAFPMEKFFVSITPIFSEEKGWSIA